MATLYEFEFTELAGEVDEKNGIVRGVSVITGGVQAKGHNLEVDLTTLEQMLDQGQSKGQVPVKWNHKTGADAVNGYLNNFRIDGNKLKADWHLLKSHHQYSQALELAVRMPRNVGLSASFLGKNEKRGPKSYARCEDLISVDLVATPAANPDGMFSAVVDSDGEDMAQPSTTTPGASASTEPCIADLLKEFASFRSDIETRFSAIEEAFTESEEEIDDNEYEEGEGEAPEAAEFGSIADVLQHFESRIDAAANDRERQDFEAAYTALESKVGQVMEFNEQLLGENQVLAAAFKELSEKTKNVVNFETAPDGTAKPVVRSTSGRKLTEFDTRVEELKRDGKGAAEAMTFAVEEDIERYQRHLEATGAIVNRM